MEYLGAGYAGFQKQPARVTVQSTLEGAISAATQAGVQVQGSGRTDAGAHALCQVVAFSTLSRLDCFTMTRAINAHLPCDIAVTRCFDVPSDFNPRKDALSRTYRYLIWNRPVRSPFFLGRAAHVKPRLDAETMDLAAHALLGRHDMTSFIPVKTEGSPVRTVYAAGCYRRGDVVAITLEATGFMKQMVRAIAGTLIRVGSGRVTAADFADILASQDRTRAGDTAPAHGLYLTRVRYPQFDMQVDDITAPDVAWQSVMASGAHEENR